MHVIAAKAVAFKEALSDEYKEYMRQVLKNADVLCNTLISKGLRAVSNGTDNHLMLIDVRPLNLTGKVAERALEAASLTCNKNTIPFETESPFVTSGIRLGSPAGTSRGFKEKEFEQIALWIFDVLKAVSDKGEEGAEGDIARVREAVEALCEQFPIYEDEL